jgi:hypothetical protein
MDFNDPNFENRPYDKLVAYGQSKTAMSLFAVAFDKSAQAYGSGRLPCILERCSPIYFAICQMKN